MQYVRTFRHMYSCPGLLRNMPEYDGIYGNM